MWFSISTTIFLYQINTVSRKFRANPQRGNQDGTKPLPYSNHYDIQVAQCENLTFHTQTMFCVETKASFFNFYSLCINACLLLLMTAKRSATRRLKSKGSNTASLSNAHARRDRAYGRPKPGSVGHGTHLYLSIFE